MCDMVTPTGTSVQIPKLKKEMINPQQSCSIIFTILYYKATDVRNHQRKSFNVP